ncbi:hypothetical protein B8W69_03945 [Mycobacterium vulneris]|uniref:Uncharacterized protein n=1 Tax=Mycolicibacterium vulneris TaxID=547163 RepID=A0A1X2LC54_9MYCO|nr:hypothetical protein [Mycolicibacterium vulneris]OSC31599.1 hypothetical protein B8W69_03945 [Mycolicibacterium vulneris]
MHIPAAVAQEVSTPFALTEVELKDPTPNEVMVQLTGVGICQPDLHDRGEFSLDKLLTTTPLDQINDTLAAQHRGKVLEAVLTP